MPGEKQQHYEWFVLFTRLPESNLANFRDYHREIWQTYQSVIEKAYSENLWQARAQEFKDAEARLAAKYQAHSAQRVKDRALSNCAILQGLFEKYADRLNVTADELPNLADSGLDLDRYAAAQRSLAGALNSLTGVVKQIHETEALADGLTQLAEQLQRISRVS